MLTKHFKPDPEYIFPRCSSGHYFQHRWLQQYSWLVYGKRENGGFCLPCFLFSSSSCHGSDPGILVSKPLIASAKSLELLRKLTAKGHHKDSVVKADEFEKVMTHKQPDVQCWLDQVRADWITLNCRKLSSIFQTVLLCGRQNIPLRVHRDNLTDVESLSKTQTMAISMFFNNSKLKLVILYLVNIWLMVLVMPCARPQLSRIRSLVF